MLCSTLGGPDFDETNCDLADIRGDPAPDMEPPLLDCLGVLEPSLATDGAIR